ncbi:hypothetical protein NQ317_014481 [Molorchus minor]|uniref:Uncharacterized protein n=1 Tax=Molorchus minor TaxID=1323400 RepID=A0ABQ9J8E1_9CUCU|nr:hypothetical protein NQ317_014481 [Molorchus minor]
MAHMCDGGFREKLCVTYMCHVVVNVLIKILHKGGFELRKWASNHEGLLSHLPTSLLHAELLCLDFNADIPIKVLGLKWHPSLDIFTYNVGFSDRPCTKRTILSELARIFDPLGFLTPLTLFAKLLLQQLWSLEKRVHCLHCWPLELTHRDFEAKFKVQYFQQECKFLNAACEF